MTLTNQTKMATKIRFYIFAVVMIAGAVLTLSSCRSTYSESRKGYGCDGRSKSITGYKGEKFIGY